jgi:hypothetical protein
MLQCSKDRGGGVLEREYFCGSLQSSQKGEIKDLIGDRRVLKKEAVKCLIYKENKVG